ncbi:MAG: hypothetical protein HYZ58_04040 [Acidobacteria bacterium]|nr:hypothetical protein [Acidobacteriota bacterium]MBI3262306.1 hypothetical protein [Acidobacteriota bacterium]
MTSREARIRLRAGGSGVRQEKLVNLASWIRTYLQARPQVYLWEVLGEPQD